MFMMKASMRLLKTLHGVSRLQFRCHQNSIGVLGAPLWRGQPHAGVAQAPKKLRDLGILEKLESLGYSVKNHGDLHFEEIENDPTSMNIKSPRTIGNSIKKISDKVGQIIQSEEVGLIMGGDNSLSMGSIHGHAHAQKDVCLVWVVACPDLNTPITSPTGNIHGMVLPFLVHELQQYMPPVPGFEWVKPCIHARDIACIGIREIDPAERRIIEDHNITCYRMHDIDKLGIHTVITEALNAINPNLDRPIHLSFDIDALDPAVAPSTGTSARGGMTIREGMYLAEEIANTGKLAAIDLVEVNPQLGTDKDVTMTLDSACDIINACFGYRREGNDPKDYKVPLP